MRTTLIWLLRGLLILAVLAAAASLWNREALARLMAVNSLFAEGRIVENFGQMGALFFSTPLARGDGVVSPLPPGAPMTLPEGAGDWITDRAMTALVVLKDGGIRYEEYFLGTGPEDLRISWSVAKSYLSVLLGIVLEEGAIASLDDPVTQYAPSLTGTAYDGASIRNVAQMASGVEFDEDYFDFWSDINRMGRVLALGGSMDGFAEGIDARFAAPGAQWQYVSIDTHVLGMVIRGATGRSIPELLNERVLQPLGPEADAEYVTDGLGVAFVLGGLNMRSRDYARFGQMVLEGGQANGRQVVSAAWIDESLRASAPTAAGREGYGYQWWLPADARPGEVFARGVYGQYIYIDRARGVVIAMNAADRSFREPGVHGANLAMFRRIAEAL